MSSFWAETGQLTSPASTGNQTYNLATNTGETPKAVIFFASFRSIGTSGSTNQTWHMLGFTTGSTAARNQCHCQQSVTANPTNLEVGFSETACVFKNADNSTTVELAAALNSFSTGAFELNWTTTTSGVVIQWVAIGGDDLSVFADNLDTGTGTGSQAETGVGFQPKAVLFVASRKSTTAGSFTSADAGFYVGVGKSSTERWASGVGNDDGVASAIVEVYCGLDNTRAMVVVTEGTGAADGRFDITSMDSDGFTIDKEDGFSASTTVSYLAIGGANINVAVGTDSQKTSTGTKSTSVGFEPECVLFWGLNQTAVDTDAAWPNQDSAYCFGAACPPSDSRSSFWAEDSGAAGQDGNDSTTKCLVFRSPTSFGTTTAEADIDASTSTEFVLNWTTADATARLFGYLAFGGVTAVARTLDAAAGSHTVTGTAATPKLGRKVAAAAGSYANNGTAAGLIKGKPLAAGAGSYAETGSAANLLRGRKVAANSANYPVTGSTAGLSITAKVAPAAAGSYSASGQDASLERGRLVSAQTANYPVNGQDVTLTKSTPGTKVVSADPGSYAASGQDAFLELNRKLAAAPGIYAATGSDVTLTKTTAAGVAPAPTGGGDFPQTIIEIDRRAGKKKIAKEKPPPPTVRQDIERAITKLYGPAEEPATAEPRPIVLPQAVIPLTPDQRRQIVQALMEVPQPQLLAFGLDAAVEKAAEIVRELQTDEEEALLMVLALTL